MSSLPQALYSNPFKEFPLWIRPALVYGLMVNFLVLLMEDEKLDDKTLASISGYYGPGSCLAWIVVLLTNVEFVVYVKVLYRVWKREQLFKDEDILEFQIDPTIISSLAYPIVAMGHYLKVYHPHPDNEETIQPQVAVMHLTIFASLLAIFTYLPYGVLLWWLDATNMQHKHFSRKSFLLRFWLWCITSVFAIYLEMIRGNIYIILQGLAFSTAFLLYMPSVDCYGGSYVKFKGDCKYAAEIAVSTSCLAVGALLVTGALGFPEEIFPLKRAWTFAFPQSSASLSDLDQAAALGVALFAVISGVVMSIKARPKDSSHSTRAQNIGLLPYVSQGSQLNSTDSGLHSVHFRR